MANFFEPGKGSFDQNTTLSPAQQAISKFKLQLLMQLLNSSAGHPTSFKDFVGGAPATRDMPAGLGNLGQAALMAMNQPGAFTTIQHGVGTPPSTSGFSDLAALLGLAGGIYNSGIIGKVLGWIPSSGQAPPTGDYNPFTTGGPNPSGEVPYPADTTNQDLFLNSLYPGGSEAQVPMADAGGAQDDFLAALLSGYSY